MSWGMLCPTTTVSGQRQNQLTPKAAQREMDMEMVCLPYRVRPRHFALLLTGMVIRCNTSQASGQHQMQLAQY
jgi:hypothetical protein